MQALTLPVLAATMAFAAAAPADAEQQQEMKIVVAGALPEESATIHWIGSGAAGLDMQAMQVGESQSIVDESGRAVLITREQEGFRFDVDGKTIVMPEIVVADMGAHREYLTLADGADVTADFDLEIVGESQAMSTFASPVIGNGGVTIITGEPLDAVTQENIKAVLLSAGRNDEVTFIDSSGAAADGRVKTIRKRVEVTQ